MKIRPHDQFGGHEGGPHLRYVQQYATSENEKSIASATGAGPIEVTSTGHGYSTGDEVTITGGDAEVNGTWIITSTGANTFTLNGSTGDGTYTSAGTIQYAQPVQVKLLVWDAGAGAFVTYGTEFRVGDTTTPDQIADGENFWIAWRRDAKRWMPISGGNETYRLIRGQSVGNQSSGTVLIDNVQVLAGGLDPSDGDPAAQITLQNVFGQSFNDNEWVQAIYNEGLGGSVTSDWEPVKTTSGTETYRAIRGLVKGVVTADDATFPIDNVIPLAGGLDPVSGNAATEITLQNIQKEAFADNCPITAIYDGANWEVLLVERYRMIRGMAVGAVGSGDGDFEVDNVEVLQSSVDPRADPTSAAETVTVRNFHGDTYADNEWVTAVYNDETITAVDWEALKKTASSSSAVYYTADAGSAISAGTPSAPNSGSATVYEVEADGTTTSLGSKTVLNPFRHAVKGALTVLRVGEENFLIAGFDVLEALYLLTGAAEKKSLVLPTGANDPTDIRWLGKEC